MNGRGAEPKTSIQLLLVFFFFHAKANKTRVGLEFETVLISVVLYKESDVLIDARNR